MRRLAAWLAIAAMALQALWPLIAQARPVTLVPVCTVAGETHYIELPTGGTTSHEHCALCIVGAALAPHAARLFAASPLPVAMGGSFEAVTFSRVEADARSPPVLPLVVIDNVRNGRKDEEASALRAARAHLGGSVVRFGILLG